MKTETTEKNELFENLKIMSNDKKVIVFNKNMFKRCAICYTCKNAKRNTRSNASVVRYMWSMCY